MSLASNVIWWHVYPLGATGAPIREPETGVRHRLNNLFDWLDHAVEIGASGIQLGPIFASETHGYDTVDYYRIDPRLGDDADFDALVGACRQRGLSVLLDGVFNHVGRQYPALVQALNDGPESEFAGMFQIEFSDGQARGVGWEGHDALVAFNHSDPRVVDLVVDVMCHWLGRGIAGWRLDAAYSVPRSFWRQVIDRVRERHPDALLVGEMIHGDYTGFVAETGMDSITQYELWKAIWSSLVDVNFWELAHALERHAELLSKFVPYTFIGNHDVTRIATKVGVEKLPLAIAALAMLPGMPALYYGDEQGFTGEKFEDFGGDDQVRPPLPDSPDDLTLGWDTFQLHQELFGLRRRNPWLQTGQLRVLSKETDYITWEVSDGEGRRIQVTLSLEGSPTVHISDNQETQFARSWPH